MALPIQFPGIILQHPFATLCLILFSRIAYLSIYRLYFHPLAKFPGSRLAVLTTWYEFYYDGIKRGQYVFEIGRMHEKYGPIVRISPDELHVNDPAFIDTLYAGGGKRREKYNYAMDQFGIPGSVFATVNHDLHRVRRGALNRFFSKASVNKLEPLLFRIVEKLCSKIEQHAGSGNAVTLSAAFACMTTDVVTEYAFGNSYDFLSQDSPEFENNFNETVISGPEVGIYVKHFPWLQRFMEMLPPSVVGWSFPHMKKFLEFQNDMRAQIKDIQDGLNNKSGKSGATMFDELLTGNLPNEEKSVERLWQDGITLIGAGTHTTAWALSVPIYYLLSQPNTLLKLRHELEIAIPDPDKMPSLVALEQLPYLTATINEGLRLAYGVSARTHRISPKESFILSVTQPVSEIGQKAVELEYEIPAGTPIGMTSVLIHHNPTLFPASYEFIPERWLDEKGQRRHDLEGYLLSFSKGSRQCLGINLAYAELYMALAAVIRKFGDRMELFETTVEDVKIQRDIFVPLPKVGSKGVRVIVGADKN